MTENDPEIVKAMTEYMKQMQTEMSKNQMGMWNSHKESIILH